MMFVPISINIEKIDLADWNYKVFDMGRMEKLKNQIAENGFLENIIVREKKDGRYEVINGNHRVECLIELGETEVVAVNLGEISLGEAKRVAIETNETRFGTDDDKLVDLIRGINININLEDMEATMPYSMEELTEIMGDFSINSDVSVDIVVDRGEELFEEEPGDESTPEGVGATTTGVQNLPNAENEAEELKSHYVGIEKYFEDVGLYDVNKKEALAFVDWARPYIKKNGFETLDDFLNSLI